MRRQTTRAVLAFGILATVAATAVPLFAQPVLYTLKDNATGGDCRARNIGLWNPATKTCTLIRNLRASIEIADDHVRLYGNLHSLKPPAQPMPFGVLAQNRTGVTVFGVVIDGFNQGVTLDGGHGNTVLKNFITDVIALQRACGVCLFQSDGNRVAGNRISGLQGLGIRLDRSSLNQVLENRLRKNVLQLYLARSMGNLIDRNTFDGDPQVFTDAIVIDHSDDNRLTRNTVVRQGGAGATLDQSDRNQFLYNDFKNDGFPAALFVRSGTGNQAVCNDFDANVLAVELGPPTAATDVVLNNFFGTDTAQDLAAPKANQFDLGGRGNHWAVNAPKCVDLNLDGICDAPYVFVGNQDNRPFVRPVPWRAYPAACLSVPPPIDELPDIAARLAVSEWAKAVANGNARDILHRLAPDAELMARDGGVIRGGDAVAAYLKGAFTGTLFVAEAFEAAAPRVVVRGRARGPAKGASEPAGVTLELMASPDREWRIVRIRLAPR
jgi:parallel beta-helix repeat protein